MRQSPKQQQKGNKTSEDASVEGAGKEITKINIPDDEKLRAEHSRKYQIWNKSLTLLNSFGLTFDKDLI